MKDYIIVQGAHKKCGDESTDDAWICTWMCLEALSRVMQNIGGKRERWCKAHAIRVQCVERRAKQIGTQSRYNQ